jgi:hypothetical protein
MTARRALLLRGRRGATVVVTEAIVPSISQLVSGEYETSHGNFSKTFNEQPAVA